MPRTYHAIERLPIYTHRCEGRCKRGPHSAYHGFVKVGFIALGRISEQGELRNAENFAGDVFHASLPHVPIGIVEYP